MQYRSQHKRCTLLAAIWSTCLANNIVTAGSVEINGPTGHLTYHVTSYSELRYMTTVKQQYDFSCGSAAVATLLSFHYEHPVTEDDVFKAMYANANKELVRKAGFSLLDIKQYLASIGYDADGYRLSLDSLQQIGVPAITLLNDDGYKHFVLIKGIGEHYVMLGDPAKGGRLMSREDFTARWNEVMFVIKNKKSVGTKYFNSEKELSLLAAAPSTMTVRERGILESILNLPGSYLPQPSRIEF